MSLKCKLDSNASCDAIYSKKEKGESHMERRNNSHPAPTIQLRTLLDNCIDLLNRTDIFCLLIHLFFLLLYNFYHYSYLTLLNGVSCLIFLSLLILGRFQKIIPVIIGTLLEPLLHATACTLILGWNYGYTLYIICMIPAVLFILVFVERGGFISSILGFACLAWFCCLKLITTYIEPLSTATYYPLLETIVYITNCFSAFILVIEFVSLFAKHVKNVNQDLTQKNITLDRLAHIDPLTNLWNRRCMDERLAFFMEKRQTKRENFCLILGDIDDFKKINDTYGHDCGDEVLKSISHIISTNVRTQDYVARWGGEEIMIILSDISRKDSLQIIQRLQEKIREHTLEYDSKNIHITMTFGLSYSDEYDDLKSLLLLVDQRLYEGKDSGKDCIISWQS